MPDAHFYSYTIDELPKELIEDSEYLKVEYTRIRQQLGATNSLNELPQKVIRVPFNLTDLIYFYTYGYKLHGYPVDEMDEIVNIMDSLQCGRHEEFTLFSILYGRLIAFYDNPSINNEQFAEEVKNTYYLLSQGEILVQATMVIFNVFYHRIRDNIRYLPEFFKIALKTVDFDLIQQVLLVANQLNISLVRFVGSDNILAIMRECEANKPGDGYKLHSILRELTLTI